MLKRFRAECILLYGPIFCHFDVQKPDYYQCYQKYCLARTFDECHVIT